MHWFVGEAPGLRCERSVDHFNCFPTRGNFTSSGTTVRGKAQYHERAPRRPVLSMSTVIVL